MHSNRSVSTLQSRISFTIFLNSFCNSSSTSWHAVRQSRNIAATLQRSVSWWQWTQWNNNTTDRYFVAEAADTNCNAVVQRLHAVTAPHNHIAAYIHISYYLASLYTAPSPPFILINSLKNRSVFNYFCTFCTTCKGCKVVHLACKLLPHYAGKSEIVVCWQYLAALMIGYADIAR